MIYVMSDIHGNLARFESIMMQIELKPADTLYILGDVVDRYPDGIKILRRVMKMPNVTVSPHSELISMFSNVALANMANAASLALDSLECDELFLTDGFKLIFSPTLARMVTNWFATQFITLPQQEISTPVEVSAVLSKALDLFGANANSIECFKDAGSDIKLVSLISSRDNQQSSLPADVYESAGTLRFIKLFPLIIQAIQTGATLVIDDCDISIHPVALMNIINLFHNDELNTNHAQLIFTAHNPVFLNSNLLRRDEIKFVERDSDDHTSSLYSLSDFGVGLGKEEDFLNRYLTSMYGAIPDIDFTPLFQSTDTLGG